MESVELTVYWLHQPDGSPLLAFKRKMERAALRAWLSGERDSWEWSQPHFTWRMK